MGPGAVQKSAKLRAFGFWNLWEIRGSSDNVLGPEDHEETALPVTIRLIQTAESVVVEVVVFPLAIFDQL